MAQQIGDLHRRRLAREDQQPAAGGVAGQIDQHVDVVLPDHVGDRRVGQAEMVRH